MRHSWLVLFLGLAILPACATTGGGPSVTLPIKQSKENAKPKHVFKTGDLFGGEGINLSEEGRKELRRIVTWLQEHPQNTAMIVDFGNPSEADKAQSSSQARAKQIMGFFTEQEISADRLGSVGLGLSVPGKISQVEIRLQPFSPG